MLGFAAAATWVAGAALAGGCGSVDERSTATTAGQLTTSAPDLAGTYERRLTHGPLQLTLDKSTLTMTDAGAGLTIRQDFSATSDGAFRIGAYQAPERGSFCGPDISQTASYTWERSGGVLTLRADDDECADRDSSLSGEWERR